MRIATFNMLHGRSMRDGRVSVERFAAAVRSLGADVLALQEVDRDQHRSQQADFTAIAAVAMGAPAHRFAAAISGTPGATWVAASGPAQSGPSYGIALLSRYPVTSWQVARLPRIPFRFPMWLPGPRRLLMVLEEPRVAVAGLVDSPLGKIAVVTTHLSFVPGWNLVQLRHLQRDIAALPDPLLLVGDLNLSGGRPARITGYRSLAGAPTFPADRPLRQLDHILLRGRLPPVRDAHAPALPPITARSSSTSSAGARRAAYRRGVPSASRDPATVVLWLLAAFAVAEAALGLALLIIGVVSGNALYIGGGVLLLAIAARTGFRRRAARRLTRRPPP